jgi:hypothetical protein
LAKKEEHQRNLDVSLAQIFENAARIEAMVKNQKTAKGLNFLPKLVFILF